MIQTTNLTCKETKCKAVKNIYKYCLPNISLIRVLHLICDDESEESFRCDPVTVLYVDVLEKN